MYAKLSRMSIVCGLMLTFGLVASAQRRGATELLGEANVDGAVDHDNIVVTAARGSFRAIQLRVVNNAVRFQRVVVHFGNGQSETLSIASRIRAGGATRIIDLPGDRRVIQSVELWYARANWGPRRPKVLLYGVH